jgi:hypothetical protein
VAVERRQDIRGPTPDEANNGIDCGGLDTTRGGSARRESLSLGYGVTTSLLRVVPPAIEPGLS